MRNQPQQRPSPTLHEWGKPTGHSNHGLPQRPVPENSRRWVGDANEPHLSMASFSRVPAGKHLRCPPGTSLQLGLGQGARAAGLALLPSPWGEPALGGAARLHPPGDAGCCTGDPGQAGAHSPLTAPLLPSGRACGSPDSRSVAGRGEGGGHSWTHVSTWVPGLTTPTTRAPGALLSWSAGACTHTHARTGWAQAAGVRAVRAGQWCPEAGGGRAGRERASPSQAPAFQGLPSSLSGPLLSRFSCHLH